MYTVVKCACKKSGLVHLQLLTCSMVIGFILCHMYVVLGDISIISKYRDINQHDNHIVRKMLLTILSKDR